MALGVIAAGSTPGCPRTRSTPTLLLATTDAPREPRGDAGSIPVDAEALRPPARQADPRPLARDSSVEALVAELSRLRGALPQADPLCLLRAGANGEGPRFTAGLAFDLEIPQPLERFDFDPAREVPEIWTERGTIPTGPTPRRGRALVISAAPWDAYDNTIALVFFSIDAIFVRPTNGDRPRRFAANTTPSTWASAVLRLEARTVILVPTRGVSMGTLEDAWRALRLRSSALVLALPVANQPVPSVRPADLRAAVMGCPSPPPANPGGAIPAPTTARVLAEGRARLNACITNRYAASPRTLQMIQIQPTGRVDFVCALGGGYSPSEMACIQRTIGLLEWPAMERPAILEEVIAVGDAWTTRDRCAE